MFWNLGCYPQGVSIAYELLMYICRRVVSLYMNIVVYLLVRLRVLGSPAEGILVSTRLDSTSVTHKE
jgi:hypothetical protein